MDRSRVDWSNALSSVLREKLEQSSEQFEMARRRQQMKQLQGQRNREIEEIERKTEETKQANEKKIREKEEEYRKEREKMEGEKEAMRQRMIERLEELMELHKMEKRNRVVIDKIFEVIRNWTDIEFFFCHLVGIKDALETADEDNESVKKVRVNMMKKANLILKLHEIIYNLVVEILDQLEETLDFVEMGKSSNQRMAITLALNCMKNIEFWTLGNELTIDEGISHLQEKMDEVRKHLRVLSLDQLRPRVSVRLRIQQQIRESEVDETRRIRSGSLLE